jgi:hypothetical protein
MDETIKALLEEERIARMLLSRHADKYPLAEQLFWRLFAVEHALAEYRRNPPPIARPQPERRRARSRSV